MAADPLISVRHEVGLRIAEMRAAAPRLSPHDLHSRLDSIRRLAACHGLAALEELARSSSQRALLPGFRTATLCCLERFEEALSSHSPSDCSTILASLAIRLH